MQGNRSVYNNRRPRKSHSNHCSKLRLSFYTGALRCLHISGQHAPTLFLHCCCTVQGP